MFSTTLEGCQEDACQPSGVTELLHNTYRYRCVVERGPGFVRCSAVPAMPLSSITDNDEGYTRSPQGGMTEIQVVNAFSALDDVKVSVDETKPSDDHPMVESTRGPSISMSADHASDSASIRSMPAATATGPSSNMPDRSAPLCSENARLGRASPSSLTGTNVGHVAGDLNSYQRRARHRSTIEVSN